MTRFVLLALVALLCQPALSIGQSLADVARAEEARRKNVKQPGKVYTNDSLKPDFTLPVALPPRAGAASDPVPATSPASDASPQKAPPAAAVSPAPRAQDEAAWRKRIAGARADLQRSQMFAEALQSRINALTADVINRDDPAQRAVIEQDRQKALAELDRVKSDIAQQTKAISDIEDDARKAGVPAGWLR